MKDTNQIQLRGKMSIKPMLFYEKCGENFFSTEVEVCRRSGNIDTIPVIIPERAIKSENKICNVGYVNIKGELRSYNRSEGGKRRLKVSVFVSEIDFVKESERNDFNGIILCGHVCKPPVHRITPLGREIADGILAVNGLCSKSNYIPYITWGRNARFASTLNSGSYIRLEGRIQSREYIKRLDDGTQETRTAYEVSVSRIDVAESEENDNESRSEENL